MGFKRVLRKLTCRPVEEDEENGLRKSDSLLGQKQGGNSSSPSRRAKTRSTGTTKSDGENDNEFRYMTELKDRQLFTIKEATGKYIDVPESFAPRPKWWMVVFKLVIFVAVAYMMVGEVIKTSPKSFFFATFDHWALTVTTMYLFMSLAGNITRKASSDPDFASGKYLPNLWHKITWVLFEIAAPSQLLATIAFWAFEYEGVDPEIMLMVHGIVLVLLLTEGLGVNRVPVRINHQWFLLSFIYAFLLWALIHSYSQIGNPSKVGEISLYSFLQWNVTPVQALLSTIFILFVVAPLAYWLVWCLSLYSMPWKFTGRYRRYLSQENKKALKSQVETNE